MVKKKVVMVGTTAAMTEQFNKDNILILEKMGYEVHVVGNFKEGNPITEERLLEFKDWIVAHGGRWFHWPALRTPVCRENVQSFFILSDLMKKSRYEFMHCYTPIGSVIGRMAAKKHHIKAIYTAHGFHFYTGAPLKNWFLYYPMEWLMSFLTDVLITINREDYSRAKRYFAAKKTVYIPGVGVDVEFYRNYKTDEKVVREGIGIKEDDIMLFSVGELIARKNHRTVLEAIYKIKNNDASLFKRLRYVVAGQGPLEKDLLSLAEKYGISDHFHLLGFRDDIPDLLQAADLFVFPSLQEGLSMALMEALSTGKMCMASDIRGNRDLFYKKDREYLIDPIDAGEWMRKIVAFFDLDEKIFYSSSRKHMERFDLKRVNKRMRTVYSWGG